MPAKYTTELQPGDIYYTAGGNKCVISTEPARERAWISLGKQGTPATTIAFHYVRNGEDEPSTYHQSIANDYEVDAIDDPERWRNGERIVHAAAINRVNRFLAGE